MRRKRSNSRLAVCILTTLVSAISALGQDQTKVLEWANHTNINTGKVDLPWSRQIDTIELQDIRVGSKSVTIGEPFPGEIDWILNLTFRIKNFSSEPVGFVQITVKLPQMKQSPEIPFVTLSADPKNSKALMPGDEEDLRIPPGKLYDWVKESVAKETELSKISRAAIYAVIIVPPKGGVESGGCLRAINPKNACPNS
ncbi:MAG TPA: hypothetical protein VFU37_19645, partial [Pyrinomonadaceae bacterium]|nr:hypothetical protein [Pyrinomonadaceae bacterium]